MPEVALKLRDVANDPNVDATKIAKVESCDTALTARIIKIVNSALMRGISGAEEIDYVDIVMVANIQVREGSDHPLASIDCSKIQAFEHLGIEVDNILASNDDLRQEVDAAIEAFH